MGLSMTESETRKPLELEFNRPIPRAYAPLIEESLKDEYFFKLGQQLAPGIIGTIEKMPEHRERFAKIVSGRDFIDLGCGSPEADWQVEHLMKYKSVSEFAKFLGAARYIRVDRFASPTINEDGGGFVRAYIPNEVLEFLSTIPDANKHPSKKFFFISGLESCFTQGSRLYPDDSKIARYHQAIYDELARVTKQGDGVYLGPRTKSFEPVELVRRGFRSNLGLNYSLYNGQSEMGMNRVDVLVKDK